MTSSETDLVEKKQPHQPGQFRKRQIRWVLLLRVILFSMLLGVSSILQAHRHELNIPPLPEILSFIFIVFTFSIGSEFLLRKSTNSKMFAYGQIFADSIFITIIVNFTGGALSIFPILYFFPVLSAGIILHTKGSIALASGNTLLFGIVLFAGHLPFLKNLNNAFLTTNTANINVTSQAFSVYGLSFFLAAILSSILSERFRQTREKLSSTTSDLDSLNILYKQIFDDISSGIITVNAEGYITSFNRAAEEITGFPPHQVLSAKINKLFPQLKNIGNHKERHTTKINKLNNDKIPIGYSWAKLNMPDESKQSLVYTLQDLSKIREMEKKVQQSEKMAAIGEIAAGIAHEFRNPLAAISGATQILCQEQDLSETNTTLLTIIKRECDRLGCNINDFLQFSKPALPEKQWFAICTIVDESLAIVKRTPGFPLNCRISQHLQINLDCWADQYQLKQILINLIHNSSQAVPEIDAEIIIKASEIVSQSGQEEFLLQVEDNGLGIEQKMLRKIYEPFFTTKENGTGLGLAIVKQIVESHDGRIDINSTPGAGTSFSIYLPLP